VISANRLPMLDSSGPVLTTQGSGPASCSSRGARALLAARPVLAKKPWMEQVESLVEEAFVTTMPVTDFRQSDQGSTWTDGGSVVLVKVVVTRYSYMLGNTMTRTAVFIGSSTLGRSIADHLKVSLEDRYDCDVTVWHEGVFELGGSTLASLETAARRMDFAVLVATADDILTTAAGKTSSAVRDNVVFELGLFIGALGSNRVYIVADQTSADLHLPSDLSGVTWARYRERADGNLDAAVGSAATKIGTRVKQLGPRIDTGSMASEISSPSTQRRTLLSDAANPPTEAHDGGQEHVAGADPTFTDGLLEMQVARWKPGSFGGVSVHGRIQNKDARSYAFVSIRATFLQHGSMVGSATGLVLDLASGATKVFELDGQEQVPDGSSVELQIDTKV